jgi:hypothetical protein
MSLLSSLEDFEPNPAACTGESLLSMLAVSMVVMCVYVDEIDVCFGYSRVLLGCRDERDQSYNQLKII